MPCSRHAAATREIHNCRTENQIQVTGQLNHPESVDYYSD